MSKGCGCSWCNTTQYKDFRRDHGGGPEELPHRKKGKGKKYCNKNKGPHVYDTWSAWTTYTKYRYRHLTCKCGKRGYGTGYQSQFLREFTYEINGEVIHGSRWA
jgi:hypothetical protein